jgi:peptide/nickel transport system substrate-binding protein
MVSVDGLGVFYVLFNVRREIPGVKGKNPLADKRVRWALAMATDSSEVVREGIQGSGHVATQLVVPQVFGFDPERPELRFDPERARALLAEVGQAGMELRLALDRAAPDWLDRRLVEQWTRVGVRASLLSLDADVLAAAVEAGTFSASVQGYSCSSADAAELLSFSLHSRRMGDGNGVGNYAGYADAEVDRLADFNLRVFDPRERLRMLRRALALAADDLPYVPLYSVQDVFVVSDALDWQPGLSDDIRLNEARWRLPR